MKTTAASATSSEDNPDFNSWVVAVWQVVRDIPRGCVLTYGDVARLAGSGGSPRRVSQALRQAPTGMKLPWHRVINSQGRISFPVGSQGHRQQINRLEKEGVVFLNGRTNLQRFGYSGALDKLFWGESV
jgi:methylated-DNA-protein-cysteine methyltransferase related protein